MKITSAYANKILKALADEKSYWENKEQASRTYVAAVGEEPVIPEYDYSAVSNTLKELDRKTVVIKHALNLANATAKIMVGDTEMSVDSILVSMAQLNSGKQPWIPCANFCLKRGKVPAYSVPEMLLLNTVIPISTWIW